MDPLLLNTAGALLVGLGLFVYLGLAWRRSGLSFGQAIKAFLTPPVLADPAETRRAAVLVAVVRPVTAAVVLIVPLMALLRRDQTALNILVLGAWSADINLAILLLARRGRGRLRLACWLFPALMFVLCTISLPAGSGSAGLATYPIIIVTASVLLGGRGGLTYALLSSLVVPAIQIGRAAGLPIAGPSVALSEWLEYASVYLITAVFLRFLTQRVETNIRHAERLQIAEAQRVQELDQSLRLERKRAQQLELLAETARRLTGINNPQALLDEAARRVVETFHFEHAAVFLVEDDRLIVHAAWGAFCAARPLGSGVSLGEGLVGSVGRSGETCWVRDAAHDERFVSQADFPVTSEVAIPLRLSKSVVGVLEVGSTQPGAIDQMDVRMLESLADLIAAGLQASQLFIQLGGRQQMAETLRRIGAAVNQSLDLPQIVDTVCLETGPAFEADRVEVWLLDDSPPERLHRAAAMSRPGAPAETADDLARRGARLSAHLDGGRARLLLSGQGALQATQASEMGRSTIVAPLSRERRPVGLLIMSEWRRAQPFTSEQAASAEFLASHLAAAVANARSSANDRRRVNELALLSDITSASLEIVDFATLLDTLADRMGELIEADGCLLVLWDGENQTARLAAVSSGLKSAGNKVEWGARASQLTEVVLQAGRAVAVADTSERGEPAGLPGAAVLSVPLIADGQWLGAAHLTYSNPRQFPAEEIAYAERAGRQIALAMGKARALAAERRRNAELQALHAASLLVNSSLDLQQVLESILQQALGLAGGQDAHIFLYDGQRLAFGAAIWADGADQEPFATPRRGGLTDTVARTAQRIVVPDVNRHPLFTDWQWGGAIVGLPLRRGDRVCGVMNVAFSRPRRFDENELRLLELLADQAAVALENARLFNAEREQRNLAEALREASVALSSSLEFEAVLDRLLDQIERVVPFDAAAILLVEATGTQVRVARSRGYAAFGTAAAWLTAAAFDLTLTANLRRMAENHQPLIVADTRTEPAWSLGRVSDQLHSWAGVPIVAHQQVMAFFTLDKVEVGFYRPEHAERLAAFAGQAALALQNARLFEDERRRAAQLTLLSEVSQQVTGTLDEGLLLQRAVQAMIDRLGFADAAILLPVQDDELEVVAMATTEQMAARIGTRQKVGTGVIGHAAEMGATYLANDIGRDPYYFDLNGRSTGAALALPLRYEAGLPGVLYLETSTPGAFSGPDVVAYETLANHIATALQNARLYSSARSRLREMTALQFVSQAIVSSLELGDIFATVVRLLHEQFGYAYVSIYELNGDRLRLQAQVGYRDELVIWEIPVTRGVTGRAVRTRQIQLIPDVAADPDFLLALDQVQSEICIPLLKDPDVLGVLDVESAPGQVLSAADVSLLSTLAGQVTVALQNARLFEAEREQRELAEALREASVALSASLDYDTVLDRLLEQIGRVVPFDTASIFLVDGARARVIRLRGYEQFGPEVLQAAARLLFDLPSVPYLQRMAQSGQPVIASDTDHDPDWVRLVPTAHVKSWAGAPISTQGQVVAFFSLDHRQPGFYRPVHGARLAAFVGQAALALENARLFLEQQRRAEEQRLLLMAARDFSAALSEAAVLQAIVRHFTKALDAASCTISQWDRVRDAVVTLYDYVPATGPTADERGTAYPLAEYPATRWVLLTRQPLVVEAADPDSDPAERQGLEKWDQARLLMVPLYTGDDVFGLLEIQRGHGSPPFREMDQQLALSLAAQAAVALENAQLHTAVMDNVRELDALLKANEALLSTLDLDPLLHNILEAAIAAVPSAEMGTIVLYDAASQQLRVRATQGYGDPRVKSLAFAIDQGYAAKAMRENHPLLIADVRQESQIDAAADIPELQSIASAMAAPLVPKGPLAAPYGVINLDATRLNAFTAADLRILVAFANTAAVAIENARLHAEVQRLAVTDSLTALSNPRAFEHALATEAYRAARYGHPLSLIIMDIDSFKLYNDTYGHLAGNDRLKAIAGILREAVRDPDMPVRYGGEEFALLLPHTNKAGAKALAERVRELAQAASTTPAEAGRPLSGYTLSLGVATLPTDALSAGQLLLAADNAELQAKRAGKNRVCAAEALVPG